MVNRDSFAREHRIARVRGTGRSTEAITTRDSGLYATTMAREATSYMIANLAAEL